MVVIWNVSTGEALNFFTLPDLVSMPYNPSLLMLHLNKLVPLSVAIIFSTVFNFESHATLSRLQVYSLEL